MNQVVIKGSRLITENGIEPADLLISGEIIEKISSSINTPSNAKEIIADGMFTMPGVIDPHVHLELNAYGSLSSDDFYTGSCAAAAGGVTTFIDFAIPSSNQSMLSSVKEKKKSASAKSIIDYAFHSQLTSWDDNKIHELAELSKYGVTSFKIFMPMTEGWGMGDDGLFEALKNSRNNNALIMVHAENGVLASHFTDLLVQKGKVSIADYPDARPNVVEREAVARAVLLAEEAKAAIYICHLSTREAMLDIRKLKRQGSDIFVESCPQYLILSDEKLQSENGYLYTCCPPLRTNEDNYELWRGIIEETIDIIGTDHCPFNKKQKKSAGNNFLKAPLGLPGIENTLNILYTEGVVKRNIDIFKISRQLSLNAALLFGLYPEKGVLQEGSDADIVVFNPEKKIQISAEKMYSNCDWSPYEGWKLEGGIEHTISRGEIIFSNDKISAKKGRGKFLKRKPSYFYI